MTQYNLLTEQTSTIIMHDFEYFLILCISFFQFSVHLKKKTASFRNNKEIEMHTFQLLKVKYSGFTEASSRES